MSGKTERLLDVRKMYGWQDGQDPRKWSKAMLALAGRTEGFAHLPRQLTEEERCRIGTEKNQLIWDAIRQRFSGAFGPIRVGEKEVFGDPGSLTIDGHTPTLFDMLVMPVDIVDNYAGDHGGSPLFMRTLKIGAQGRDPWMVKTINRDIPIPQEMTRQCLELLSRWQRVFPQEDTFVRREFGVPSLLVRLDCVWSETRGLEVCEVEDRPQGAGISLVVNEQFSKLFSQLREEWPEFVSVVSRSRLRQGGDDYLWVREIPLAQALSGRDLVLVRSEPHEKELHALAPRSISTIALEGVKSYGVALGLWEEITWQDVQNQDSVLPWTKGFCLKPLQGSKTHGVIPCPPGEYGTFERARVMREIQAHGKKYLQRFIPPMQVKVKGRPHNFIYRIFFGWSPRSGAWIPLGGGWDARPAPQCLIHGALDAISGPSTLVM